MVLEKLFELAEQAIEKTYPNFYNKPKGYWGDSHIPNYGILKTNIVEVLESAMSKSNKWIPIENFCYKSYNPKELVQLYGKKIIGYAETNDEIFEEESKIYVGYMYLAYGTAHWCDVRDEKKMIQVTHIRYLNQDKPN